MASNTRKIMMWFNNGQEKVELVVNPKELTNTETSNHTKMDLLNVGTVKIAGNRGLQTLSISTFLPGEKSPFYKGDEPQAIIAMIRKWKNSGKPIRVIVSGTDINTAFLIDSLSETYIEGDLDVGLGVELEEYRFLNVPVVSSSSKVTSTGLKERPSNLAVPKKVIVKQGDTLWGIAVRYYADGSKWQKIATANAITNPKALAVGKELVIPE